MISEQKRKSFLILSAKRIVIDQMLDITYGNIHIESIHIPNFLGISLDKTWALTKDMEETTIKAWQGQRQLK